MKNEVNVLMVFALYPPYSGGAAVYSNNLIKLYQTDSRIANILFLTEKNDGIENKEVGKLKIRDVLMRKHSLESSSFFYRILTYVVVNLTLAYFLFKFKLSGGGVVHLHGSYKYLLPLLVGRALKLRVIVDIRDLYVSTRFLSFANLVGYASRNIEKKLRNSGLKVEIAYFPVLFDKVGEIGVPDHIRTLSPYIFYAGELSANKNIDRMLKSFVDSNIDAYNLVLAGKNKLDCALSDVKNVEYLGELSHQQVLEYIAGSELVINPSTNEGLSRLCIEAILLDKPVVFSSVSPELKTLAAKIVDDVCELDFENLLNNKEMYRVKLTAGELDSLFDISPVIERYFN